MRKNRIDWSAVVPISAPRVPDLNRAQFEWVMTTRTAQGNYLEDIINTVIAALKTGVPEAEIAPNPEAYRLVKSKISSQRFVFEDTMALIGQFSDLIAYLYPTETITEATILAAWMGAARA